MKRILTKTIIIAAACLTITGTVDASSKDNNQTQRNLADFFTERINGRKADFKGDVTLKQSEVEKYQTLVWEAWKQANSSFKEEKLIGLAALDSTRQGKWNLPESLEPNAVMPYYYGYKTSGNERTEALPLFLYIHGSGPKDYEWRTGLQLAHKFEDAPSIYFIPQIPNEGKYYRWWQRAKQWAWTKLLRQALASGDVDANRLYVFGISEGGYGSQRLASFYADYWAGAGPMAGGEPLRNAPVENCANTNFSLLTGAEDTGFYRDIFTKATMVAFDSIQAVHKSHFNHRIELIPGHGHHIDYRPTTPWLRQYVRNPYPKQVYWENFEMDSLYRDGFYNIYVNERSNKDFNSRTYYEMNIKNNDIDLKVSEVEYEITEKDPNWDIDMAFVRHYKPAKSGKITLYLNNQLVDLSQKVNVRVNGKKVYSGKPKLTLRNMANSCAAYFDPWRIYPAAIEIEIK